MSKGSSEATKFIEIHRKVVRDVITTNIIDQNSFYSKSMSKGSSEATKFIEIHRKILEIQ